MSEDSSHAEGLLLIDKPTGPTSHDIVDVVRRVSGIRRVGHTGTLDPLASGLMIICLGRATRLAEYVSSLPKSYRATVRLGQETDSYDSEGSVIWEKHVSFSSDELNLALNSFRGEIFQKPPLFSAKKVKGVPLYKLARKGQQVSIPERSVTIYDLELIGWEQPDLDLFIRCSSGAYIRAIAHDLGSLLNCGGHITSLRRISIGDFSVSDSVPLSTLSQHKWMPYLRPSDAAVGHLSRLMLSEQDSLSLLNGRIVEHQSNQPKDSLVRAYDPHGHFVGIVILKDKFWRGKKIFYGNKSARIK